MNDYRKLALLMSAFTFPFSHWRSILLAVIASSVLRHCDVPWSLILLGILCVSLCCYVILPPVMRMILNARLPPFGSAEVQHFCSELSSNRDSQQLRFHDVEYRIPRTWGTRTLGDQRLIITPPTRGFVVSWKLSNANPGTRDPLQDCRDQVEAIAWARRWRIRQKREITIDSKTSAIDVVAEARNGMVHRFIQFCHGGKDYTCEIEAGTPRLFESAGPILDGLVATWQLV
jgi:hypothetical protein